MTNLFPEERIQLERGDIPYFFKRLGDDRLLYLANPDGREDVVSDYGEFLPDVQRHAQSPKILLNSGTAIERKMVQWAL